jgi:hypothetical protein
MSSVRRLEEGKLRTRRIVVTAMLTIVTAAFLLLTDTSVPVGAAPPAQGPSVQAADEQVPSDPAEAEETPPAPAPEDQALYPDPEAHHVSASDMPRSARPEEE